MTSVDTKEIMDELYDAMLITVGAVGVSMVSARKVLKVPLGTPESIVGTFKLAGAVCAGTLIVKWLQSKKYLPTDPFKSK